MAQLGPPTKSMNSSRSDHCKQVKVPMCLCCTTIRGQLGALPGKLYSKLLKGGYIGDYIGDYYRGYSGGILGV